MNHRERRNADRLKRFGPPNKNSQINQPEKLGETSPEKEIFARAKMDAESMKSVPYVEPSRGEGVKPRLTESGIRVRTEQRMLIRAANWQQKNRVPVEMTISNGKLVAPADGQCDGAEEIYSAVIEAVRSPNERLKAAGVRAGVQLLKLVQSDDHAKLKAELRPTVINQQVNVDQSTHTDNRRVMLMIPDNGRDPEGNVASE